MSATASSEHPNIGLEGIANFAIDGDEVLYGILNGVL